MGFHPIKSLTKRIKKKWFNKISKTERQKLNEIQTRFPEIMSFDKMIDFILAGGSIVRFGDGEFSSILQIDSDAWAHYQRHSIKLTNLLKKALTSQMDNLLVCIPQFNPENNNIEKFYKDISFWERFWLMLWDDISPLLSKNIYGNTDFSRESIFYDIPLDKLKKIWDGRDCVFVVPRNGRFFYEPRLFDNVKSRTEITIPASNAFDEYSRIFDECMRQSKDKLFLLAGGMCVKAMIPELVKSGRQCVDIGHLPNCFLEFLKEAPRPEALPLVRKDCK